MNVVVLIVFMNTMRVFDFVYVTTKGGPVDSTQVLATIIYRETFQFFHVGFGSAFAVVTLAIILVASLAYLYVRERRA
jgi:ABC-type sugar transport system permease subunit